MFFETKCSFGALLMSVGGLGLGQPNRRGHHLLSHVTAVPWQINARHQSEHASCEAEHIVANPSAPQIPHLDVKQVLWLKPHTCLLEGGRVP